MSYLDFDPDRAKRFDEYRRLEAEKTIREAENRLFRAGFKVTGCESCFLPDEPLLTVATALSKGYIKGSLQLQCHRTLDRGFWLIGPSRIGKSTLLKCLAAQHAALYRKETGIIDSNLVKMVRWEILYSEYIKKFSTDKNEVRGPVSVGIEEMKRCSVLIIDELPKTLTAYAQSLLFEILEKRVIATGRKSFFTSNYSFSGIQGLENVGLVGRIKEACYEIINLNPREDDNSRIPRDV